MSIATKTGDKGETSLLFGTRAKKSEAVFNSVGTIDELNASLGLLKASIAEKIADKPYYNMLEEIQHRLTLYMGELVCEPEKTNEYVMKYSSLKEEDLSIIELAIEHLESLSATKQKGWILYGNSPTGALADFASKVCRRAERTVVNLTETKPVRDLLIKYINRLSDVLHLMARYFDHIKKNA